MKIRKPSLPTVGVAYSLAVMGSLVFLPKTAPVWLWTTVQVAMFVWLMAFAATSAVLWERYGPNGYRLHEWEAKRAASESLNGDGGEPR